MINNTKQQHWNPAMTFRNPLYIYYASVTHIELLLAIILILTGLTFVLPQEHVSQDGTMLFGLLGNIKLWGMFFCSTGAASLMRIWYPTKPHWLITEILRHTTNFLFSILSLSMMLAYPFLPWTATYVCLSFTAFFCAVRFDKRERYNNGN